MIKITHPIDTSMLRIFFDMDGVLADFYGYIKFMLGDDWKHILDNTRYWHDFAEEQELFLKLEVLHDARQLVDDVLALQKKYKFSLAVLTAIPCSGGYKKAPDHKKEWIDRLFPELSEDFRIGPFAIEKQNHCAPFDVLMDDNPYNIAQWHLRGGFGILHAAGNARLTAKALEEYLRLITKDETSERIIH